MRVTKRIHPCLITKEAILYLFNLGYGKDSISLILKGLAKSGQIERYLRENGHVRSIKESIALRMKNGINANAGYGDVRQVMRRRFPGLPWTA